MKLIFAIGNPGTQYSKTYHNLGLILADFLEERRQQEIIAKTDSKNYTLTRFTNFTIIKSKVYMNLSFSALSQFYVQNKLKPEDLLVLHDDLTVPRYSMKLKLSGSAAGHNGLKDICKHIGQNFARIRIGIDHPKNFNPALEIDKYVLSKIPDIQPYIESFPHAEDLIQNWIAS